jgi:hypothetical protein
VVDIQSEVEDERRIQAPKAAFHFEAEMSEGRGNFLKYE